MRFKKGMEYIRWLQPPSTSKENMTRLCELLQIPPSLAGYASQVTWRVDSKKLEFRGSVSVILQSATPKKTSCLKPPSCVINC